MKISNLGLLAAGSSSWDLSTSVMGCLSVTGLAGAFPASLCAPTYSSRWRVVGDSVVSYRGPELDTAMLRGFGIANGFGT